MEPTYQQQPAYQRPGYPPQGAAPASKRTKKKPPASKDQQLYIDVLDIGGHDHLLFDSD
jgi:hypothetical protein